MPDDELELLELEEDDDDEELLELDELEEELALELEELLEVLDPTPPHAVKINSIARSTN